MKAFDGPSSRNCGLDGPNIVALDRQDSADSRPTPQLAMVIADGKINRPFPADVAHVPRAPPARMGHT